jgi:O-antigen ligase
MGLDPVQGVCGTFKSRNVLGGWLALVLPIVFGVALYAERLWLRLGLLALLAVGLLVDLAAASLYAILGVMALMAAVRGWPAFLATMLAATLWVGGITGWVGSFPDPAQPDARLNAQTVLFRSAALYTVDGQAERRYPQWQSACEMMLTYPWTGKGVGNYQRTVESFTGAKPMPTGPSEPDIQNTYLVIGSTMGIPALLGFLALLLVPAFQAGAAASRHAGWRRGVVCGVAGGIAAFAVTAVWHSLLVRGIGLHLVLLLVVARLLWEWSATDADGMPAADGGALPDGSDAPDAVSPRHGRRFRRRWHHPGARESKG